MGTPVSHVAPVVVGKIAPMGAFVAELNYTITGSDTTYSLVYNNAKYTKIDDIRTVRFAGTDNTAGKLYEAFKSAFQNKNTKDYALTFSLGKEVVSVSPKKNMGVWQAMFLVGENYMLLTEKQVDKLFGK